MFEGFGAEEAPQISDLALARHEEVVAVATHPAPRTPRDHLGRRDRQRGALDQHAGEEPSAVVQKRRFRPFTADRQRLAVAEKARETDQRVEQLGGQLRIQRDPRAVRFAVERKEADYLLLLQ